MTPEFMSILKEMPDKSIIQSIQASIGDKNDLESMRSCLIQWADIVDRKINLNNPKP